MKRKTTQRYKNSGQSVWPQIRCDACTADKQAIAQVYHCCGLPLAFKHRWQPFGVPNKPSPTLHTCHSQQFLIPVAIIQTVTYVCVVYILELIPWFWCKLINLAHLWIWWHSCAVIGCSRTKSHVKQNWFYPSKVVWSDWFWALAVGSCTQSGFFVVVWHADYVSAGPSW